MSGRDELRQHEQQRGNGTSIADTPEGLCAQLTELLDLEQARLEVVGATVFGRGPAASVDLHLTGDVWITFERFGDIGKPAVVAAALMSSVGVVRTLKPLDAMMVGALIFKLAQHHSAQSADDTAHEWGAEYLRVAPVQEVDLEDQDERWRAFESIAGIDPVQAAGLSGMGGSAHAIASASVVLVEKSTGVSLVRCGWFMAYVRCAGGLYAPAALGTQMARIGWRRRGSEGWIKATSPTDGRSLRWRFYVVPAGWENV